MNLKQCLLTANSCYKKGTKMKNLQPTGIVVHSTGANNPYLKRYVQPLKTDANYKELMKDLGLNSYGNHWNEPGRNACVHAFIGKTANKEIATYQTLPFTYCCWGSCLYSQRFFLEMKELPFRPLTMLRSMRGEKTL